MLGIAAVMDILILVEILWILYPIALISSAGVLVLLTMGLYHGVGNADQEGQYLYEIELPGQLSDWWIHHRLASDRGDRYFTLFMDGNVGGFCPVKCFA